jgi:hypothetical protein
MFYNHTGVIIVTIGQNSQAVASKEAIGPEVGADDKFSLYSSACLGGEWSAIK